MTAYSRFDCSTIVHQRPLPKGMRSRPVAFSTFKPLKVVLKKGVGSVIIARVSAVVLVKVPLFNSSIVQWHLLFTPTEKYTAAR